jgi:hypothetical protein
MIKVYNSIGQISNEDFKQLVDKTNNVSQILLSHFLAFHVITVPVIVHEDLTRDLTIYYNIYVAWAIVVHSQLPPAFKHLNEWPRAALQTALPRVKALKERPDSRDRNNIKL